MHKAQGQQFEPQAAIVFLGKTLQRHGQYDLVVSVNQCVSGLKQMKEKEKYPIKVDGQQ